MCICICVYVSPAACVWLCLCSVLLANRHILLCLNVHFLAVHVCACGGLVGNVPGLTLSQVLAYIKKT